jgi:hypothetical protein
MYSRIMKHLPADYYVRTRMLLPFFFTGLGLGVVGLAVVLLAGVTALPFLVLLLVIMLVTGFLGGLLLQ